MLQDFGPRERSRYNIPTILLDPCNSNLSLCLVQKVEAFLGLFGKIYNPPVCCYANEASDGTLDDEHPLPAFDATTAVESVQAKIDNSPGSQDNYFTALQERKSKLELLSTQISELALLHRASKWSYKRVSGVEGPLTPETGLTTQFQY